MTKVKLFLTSVICVCSLIIISSCRDDDKEEKRVVIDISHLHSGEWKLVSQKEDGNNTPIEACDADDRLVFFNTGNFRRVVGASECSAEDSDLAGTWVFNAANNKLTTTFVIDGFTSTLESEIVALTATTFRIETQGENDSGKEVTVEQTYNHW